MIQRRPKFPAEEAGRRGDEIYQRAIRSQVEPVHDGRVVAIDIESEDFIVDDTALAAAKKLRQRVPEAEVWCIRVGSPTLRQFGTRGARTA